MKLEHKDCMLVMIVLIYNIVCSTSYNHVSKLLQAMYPTHACTNILYEIPVQVDDFSRCNTQKQGFLEPTNAKSLQAL